MLKKINLKKRILITLIFFILTLTLFSIGKFIYLNFPFAWEYILKYGGISLVIALYLFFIMQSNFNLAFLIFILGYVFSFALYLINTRRAPTGILHTATMAAWYIIMVLVAISGLSLEYLFQTRRKNKILKQEAKEKEKLEQKQKEEEKIKEVVKQHTE